MSKWIKCSERMPELLGTYIVCGKMKYSFEREYEYFVDAAEYAPYDDNVTNSDAWLTWNDWYEGQDEYEIIAWMEMPEYSIDEEAEEKQGELIRCQDCKWCDNAGRKRALICTNPYIDVDAHPDFFCGYAERRADGKES